MDWDGLRAEFPITERWAFFDHAAVAPLSGRARKAMGEWAADVCANAAVNIRTWISRIEATRALAGRLINCDPRDIAFIKNTSEGVGIVAEGLPWQSGDNVVTAAEEFPANLFPWMNLAHRGVELRTIPSRDRRVRIDDLRAAIDGRTRLVTLSVVEYATGFRNDLDAVGNLCREKGVLFFVDAIQGLGVFPVDVQTTPIDFLAADGHKWLLGTEGAGLFYIRRALVERLHPVGIGWNSVVGSTNFSKVDFQLKPHAGRWESGSLNVAGIVALGESLQLLLEIGIPAISERVLHLTDYLCERAPGTGFEVYSSRAREERSNIVSLEAGQRDLGALVRRLRKEGIVVNQRAGRLRVSPHCYNTTQEIDRLIEALKSS